MLEPAKTVKEPVLDTPTVMEAAQELRVAQLLHTEASVRVQLADKEKSRADLGLANALNHLRRAREALNDAVIKADAT